MATITKKAPDTKALQAEIKFLKAENSRMNEVFTVIQTRNSRKLLYDNLTLADAKQIGMNINALLDYAAGDMTKAELKKALKHVPV